MDPGDILSKILEDPEEQKREQQLVEDLNVLHDQLLRDRANVSDAELLGGIRKQFGFGVRHEYGLLRDDQRTQRETMPLEEGMVSNMWEIAEELKLEYGVGNRASARLRLGSDPSRSLRMTMREMRWMPNDYWRA